MKQGHQVYVISAGRYNDLPFTVEQKKSYIFCVKDGEKKLYQESGCEQVYETGKLIPSRNFALDHAFERQKMCIQLSDDIKEVKTNPNSESVNLADVVEEIAHKFKQTTGVYLLGIPPTDNPFFAKSIISKNTFCIGDLFFSKPNPLRFDEKLTLKEDYDYTLQHCKEYGIVLRYQKYLFSFVHYKNQGGVVSYRNDEEEQNNIRLLKLKWGKAIKDNPKRKNEILLKINGETLSSKNN